MTIIQTAVPVGMNKAKYGSDLMLWCIERGIKIEKLGSCNDENDIYVYHWSVWCSEESLSMFCLRWPAKIVRIPRRSELEKI